MANFGVSVDITMAKTIYVDAETREEAIEKVNMRFAKNPYDYARNFSHYVEHSIVDVEEAI